jgi:hypothetical protein
MTELLISYNISFYTMYGTFSVVCQPFSGVPVFYQETSSIKLYFTRLVWLETKSIYARCRILTAMKIHIIFWVVTPCNDLIGY